MENQCGVPPATLATVQVGDTIQATTLMNFRTRVIALYNARGVLPLPTWTAGGGNTTIGAGTTIRAADLVSLRTALDNPALIAACGTCNNNAVQDNGETGVDCGGGGCPACGGNAINWNMNDYLGARLVVMKGATTILNQNSTTSNQSGTLSGLTGVHDITAFWNSGSGNTIKMRVCDSSNTEVHYEGNINNLAPISSTYTTVSMPSPAAPYTVYVTAGNIEPQLCGGAVCNNNSAQDNGETGIDCGGGGCQACTVYVSSPYQTTLSVTGIVGYPVSPIDAGPNAADDKRGRHSAFTGVIQATNGAAVPVQDLNLSLSRNSTVLQCFNIPLAGYSSQTYSFNSYTFAANDNIGVSLNGGPCPTDTTVAVTNTSLNVNLTTSDIDSVVVPFPGGYPIIPGAPGTSTTMTLAPTVALHFAWTGGDITGQHITVTDTANNSQCTLVQQGDPDPQDTFAGMTATPGGTITIEVGDGPCTVCNNNTIQDNGETGVDCGGGGCPSCSPTVIAASSNVTSCSATIDNVQTQDVYVDVHVTFDLPTTQTYSCPVTILAGQTTATNPNLGTITGGASNNVGECVDSATMGGSPINVLPALLCTPPVCDNDNVCEAGETNTNCPSDCYCGDGVVDLVMEDCDLGAGNGACPSTCSNSCTLNACGGPGGCGGVYATCFVADTKVTMADGSMKNIQDVQIGDVLKGETGDNTVQAFHQPKLNGKVYSFNGGRYFVTEEHPFKTTDGWKSLNPEKTALEHTGITVTQLAVGDTLITEKGPIKLESVEGREEPADTKLYNFMLSGDRTYYADGYLVHNKVACSGDGSGDPQCPGTIPCLTAGGLAIPPMDPTGGTCALPCGVPTSNPGSFCASNPTSNFCDADLYMHKCAGNTCTPPSCNNNSVQDNGETGIDCGGGGCPPCPVCIPDGAICSTNYTTCSQGIQVDCAAECCSNTFHTRPNPSCAGTEDVCGPATCTDNIQNGTETGVDCGGTCPPCGTCHTVGELDVNCGAGERCCIDPGGVPDVVHGGTYNICSATCPTCTNSVQDQDETGVDCGGTYCPPCGTPECWGCFNTTGDPSGVYCSSDGTPAQTNACISSCSMPYQLPAQVPLSYCSSGCGPITASIGDLANICNTYYDLYYASPDTGFQVGNLVFTDVSCTIPVSGTAIRDGGGTVYNMSVNQIGPPTGNTC